MLADDSEEEQDKKARRQLKKMKAPCAGCIHLSDARDLHEGRLFGACISCKMSPLSGYISIPINTCANFRQQLAA